MPARERESIRFVLIPFSAPPFRHPGYLSLAHNPGGSRAAPTVVVSFHSPRSRLSPRSPPRGATSAPRLASLRKQSRTPGPPAFTTTSATFGFQLWLELPRRHLTPPFHDTVGAFSSSFFPASSPVPFLFSHTYVSFIPSAEPRLPSKSLHALPSLFSLFSLSLRPSFSRFFLLFFSRKWLTPPFTFLPPLPLICVISCFFLYFSSDSTLYMHVCGG